MKKRMTNKEKLEELKKFLTGYGIPYTDGEDKKIVGHSDLNIPCFNIFIKLSGKDNDEFYQAHKYAPIFIRDEESVDFIIKKVMNVAAHQMECIEKHQAKVKQKEANRKKMEQEREERLKRKMKNKRRCKK